MNNSNNLIDRTPQPQIAGVVIPAIDGEGEHGSTRVEETLGLVGALGVEMGFHLNIRVRQPNAGRLFGEGQLDTIEEGLIEAKANLLIVDCALSPIQQRNLENSLRVKVMDRTGLILEIFGVRARTAEGRLQVEMARQLYERSRLVRTWTHLERQRGGTGFLAGPGESQLEADRRMLDRRIAKLKSELEDVRRTRRLQRSGRKKRGSPIIAFVGYTNAGKSTLFNTLTGADVFAADMPFATLDPTARDLDLESGKKLSLIDTVGFITDLPTHLVESFKATIEEAIEADLLVHVRDISHPDTERQSKDVDIVLTQIEEETKTKRPKVLEVWNKIDLLSEADKEEASQIAQSHDDVVAVSALKKEGIDTLLQKIEAIVFPQTRIFTLSLSASMGKERAWLYANCAIHAEDYSENGNAKIQVEMSVVDLNTFVHLHPLFDPDTAILGSRFST